MVDDAAIRTLALSKRYGETEALAGLSMTVPRGLVFGFLGPNGSGKTTTVKLLLGLASPSGGEAWLLGMPAGHRQTRQRVGYLPELFRYQAWLTAREVLALHCRLAELPRPSWPGEIDASLATVGLADRGSSRVGTFSKGMQQRLGLAVALVGDPELVILDEPTSALDPVGRHDTRTIIRELRDRGCAVFLNSHLLGEVEQVCDQVAVISQGRLIASGPIDQLLGAATVRLRLTGVDAGVIAAIDRHGARTQQDGWISVRGIDPDAVPQLVADVVAAGGRVHAVEPVRQSLEDRFLSLLRGEPT
ncbi:MAG TPA: ABC transporter ATP-binding protein [Candidatus Binatia bacterium]|nr:ABC transporter ATP-binding protein [Candidatus Binatia bacterium]